MTRILPPWPEDRLADSLFEHAKTIAGVIGLLWLLGPWAFLFSVL